MSIPVAIDDLVATTADYGWAYLVTVRDDSRPHVVAVTPAWDGERLAMAVGAGTARNAAQRSSIAVCYPPIDAGGYSLIVDGEASVEDGMLRLRPTGAVLHRPAPDADDGPASVCGHAPVGPPGG